MAIRTVPFTIKKIFTTNVITVYIDPCDSLKNIYTKLFNAAKPSHYPEAEPLSIEFVSPGIDAIPAEHGPKFDFDRDICFKNTELWSGYDNTYSWYSRKYNTQCSICYSDIEQISTPFTCPHAYCTDCINTWMERSPTCPTCRSERPQHQSTNDIQITNFINQTMNDNINSNIIRNDNRYLFVARQNNIIRNNQIIDNINTYSMQNNLVTYYNNQIRNNYNNNNNLDPVYNLVR